MYRSAISFAAAAIGISCIASDALARGGGPAHGGAPVSVGSSSVMKSYSPATLANKAYFPSRFGKTYRLDTTSGAPTGGGMGGGAALGAPGTAAGPYYAPTSYIGNPTMCGRYPYPPCKVRTR
jgi:hypothetical protein